MNIHVFNTWQLKNNAATYIDTQPFEFPQKMTKLSHIFDAVIKNIVIF